MRREGTSLGILFIDLDGLKQINDTHGHEAGDAALVAIARAMQATTRKSTSSGDSEGMNSLWVDSVSPIPTASPNSPTESFRKVSGQIAQIGDTSIVLGCSIGIAISEPPDMEIDSIIHRADVALYGAKMTGRGRAVWLTPISQTRGFLSLILTLRQGGRPSRSKGDRDSAIAKQLWSRRWTDGTFIGEIED